MPPKTRVAKTTQLSKDQLKQIELGINTYQTIKAKGGLGSIAVSKGSPGSPVECEVVALVAEAALLVWNVYQYTKFNQFEHQDFFEKQIANLKTLDVKSKFSVGELTKARNQLNRM